MSCSGLFESLLRKAERESFNMRVLEEIQDVKDRLKRRMQSLMVNGDFRKSNGEIDAIKAELKWLEQTEWVIKKLVET